MLASMSASTLQTELSPLHRCSLFATTFMVGVVGISLGPLLDSILRDFHAPVSEGGLISMGFALGQVLGVLLLNFFLARMPLKWSLAAAAWLQTVALLAAATLSQGLWSLVGAYLFVGLGCAFLLTIPGMLVGSKVKQGTARAMLQLLLFFAVGMMVAPLVIGLVLGAGGTWRWVFAGETGISLVLAVLLTMLPLPDVPGRENLRLRQVREVVSFNPKLFTTVAAVAFAYIGAEFILNVWLAKFEIDTLGASKTWASIAVALFWVGIVLGRLIAQAFTRRFATSRMLLAGTATMAVFAFGIALSSSQALTDTFAFFAGLGASASYPLICSYSAKFPKWHAGVVFSAVVFVTGAGRLIFPYVVGPLAAAAGFRVAIGLAALLAFVVVLLTFSLHGAEKELQDETAAPAA